MLNRFYVTCRYYKVALLMWGKNWQYASQAVVYFAELFTPGYSIRPAIRNRYFGQFKGCLTFVKLAVIAQWANDRDRLRERREDEKLFAGIYLVLFLPFFVIADEKSDLAE